ncbi:hypothetical protein ABPG72_007093 [Tetrahymena utriculariae]
MNGIKLEGIRILKINGNTQIIIDIDKIQIFNVLLIILVRIGNEDFQMIKADSNDNCYNQAYSKYYDYINFKFINKEQCQKGSLTTDIYLNTSDKFSCNKNKVDCFDQKIQTIGYYILPKDSTVDYYECKLCPYDKPIGVENQSKCSSCPVWMLKILSEFSFSFYITWQSSLNDEKQYINENNKIKFSLQKTSKLFLTSNSPCVSIDLIAKNSSYGIFDTQLKLYFSTSNSVGCPKNSIEGTINLPYNGDTKEFKKKCNWCPLDKPESKDGQACTACQTGYIVDEESHSCFLPTNCKNIIAADQKACYKSSCPKCYFIDKQSTLSKCSTYPQGKFPSVDQTQCVSDCSDSTLHEASQS